MLVTKAVRCDADRKMPTSYYVCQELRVAYRQAWRNTDHGHNTCDFVSMEDQSPESVAKLTEALKKQQDDKESAKWDARDKAALDRRDEVMWSYEVEDCGVAQSVVHPHPNRR